jgi:hypothetical protein
MKRSDCNIHNCKTLQSLHTKWDWEDDITTTNTTTFMIKMKKIPQKATVSITIKCLK